MSEKTKNSSFSEYFGRILKQYRELQHASSQHNAYRIIEINESKKSGRVELIVQVVGKSCVFKAKPEKIAADDKLLENFSKQDVRTITYFATQEIQKPKYKILVKEFCSAFNKMIFSVKKHDSEKVTQITAEELSQNKDLLNELSPEEAHLIGYTVANEKTNDDAQQREQLHDQEIPKQKIIKQEHSTTLGKTIYTLEEKTTKKRVQKTAQEISEDKRTIKGLKQDDAHKIGYASAHEHNLQKPEQDD